MNIGRYDYQFKMVLLEEGREFENLIDSGYYFKCLSVSCELELSEQDFVEWGMKQPDWFQRKAFSKKVGDWLIAEHRDVRFSKQNVMETAVLLDPKFEHWELKPIETLMEEILAVAESKCLLLEQGEVS